MGTFDSGTGGDDVLARETKDLSTDNIEEMKSPVGNVVSSKLDLQPVNEQIKKSRQEEMEKSPEEILNTPVEGVSEKTPENGEKDAEEHTVNIELRPKKSYEVEEEGLPNNLMENGVRNRPINVPQFQVSEKLALQKEKPSEHLSVQYRDLS